jgi:hypothetical protein
MRIVVLLILIISIVMAKNIIGRGDHDKIAHELVGLKSLLQSKSVEELRSYCLKIEDYERQGKFLIGGLHDYIQTMDKDECMKYILTSAMNNKELLKMEKFYTIVEPDTNSVFLSEDEKLIGGGDLSLISSRVTKLLELFKSITESELQKWAMRVHNWEKKNGFAGSEHGYPYYMTKDTTVQYIIAEAVNFKQLLDYDFFVSNICNPMEEFHRPYVPTGPGQVRLSSVINTLDRKDLERFALTCEKYVRDTQNLQGIYGGIHDNFVVMDNEQLGNYILSATEKYPVIDGVLNLNMLADKYLIKYY